MACQLLSPLPTREPWRRLLDDSRGQSRSMKSGEFSSRRSDIGDMHGLPMLAALCVRKE